jgi:hypothetical protein
MSTNSSTLYWANGPNLYALDTTTGFATLVGNMGGPQLGALIMTGGTLFGGEDSPAIQVVTLDPGTGVATAGPALSGISSNFFGLAPELTTPEPGTWGLFATGIAGMALLRRRMKRASRHGNR